MSWRTTHLTADVEKALGKLKWRTATREAVVERQEVQKWTRH